MNKERSRKPSGLIKIIWSIEKKNNKNVYKI